MQQRPLGRAGLLVSRLALGTMTWGRDTAPDDAAAQLKTFVDAGGNLLDTADVYGDGDAESVVGNLLSGVVDIPNSCSTVYIPTAIFDFDVRPSASGPHQVRSAMDVPKASFG